MGQHESPYGSFFYSTIGEPFFYCSFYRTCLPAVVSNDLEDLSNMAFLLTYSGKYQESFNFCIKTEKSIPIIWAIWNFCLTVRKDSERTIFAKKQQSKFF